jgi:hypothetical protein
MSVVYRVSFNSSSTIANGSIKLIVEFIVVSQVVYYN